MRGRCDLLAGIKGATGQRSRQVASRAASPEPPFARGQVLPIMCTCQSQLNDCAACRLLVREGLREKPRAREVGRVGMLWDGGEGHAVPIDRAQA